MKVVGTGVMTWLEIKRKVNATASNTALKPVYNTLYLHVLIMTFNIQMSAMSPQKLTRGAECQ